MFRRLVVLVLVLGAVAPRFAVATGSLRCPVGDTPHVLLGYGGTYAEAGQSRVHRGADLAAWGGSGVHSCADGVVTFAGTVPSSATSRTIAVTVKGVDGLRVTYSPLASASVVLGASVGAGQPVGVLAAEGDASTSQPHLHLSVRNGDAYLDPVPMLAAAPPADETPFAHEAQPNDAPSAARPAPALVSAQANAPRAVTGGTPAHVVAPQPAPWPASVPQPRPSSAPRSVASLPAGVPRATSLRPTALRPTHTSALRVAHTPASPASSAASRFLAAWTDARRLATYAAELLVAAAFMWPVWRRVSRTSAIQREAAPVRVRA